MEEELFTLFENNNLSIYHSTIRGTFFKWRALNTEIFLDMPEVISINDLRQLVHTLEQIIPPIYCETYRQGFKDGRESVKHDFQRVLNFIQGDE